MKSLVTIFLIPYMIFLSNGANILVIPLQFKSTIAELKHIGEVLVDNGHNVDMILPSTFKDNPKENKINKILYKPKYYDVLTDLQNITDELAEMALKMTHVEMLFFPNNEDLCRNLLEASLEKELQKKKYDVALVHAFAQTRCFLILPYKLGIPVISVTTFFEPWLLRAPDIPSFVPFIYTEPPVDAAMSYYDRLKNFWNVVFFTYISRSLPTCLDEYVSKYAPEKPFISLEDLAAQSVFWLIDSDVLIDYPKPVMPNMAFMAGVSLQPSKPLPAELELLSKEAKSGIILATFGSMPFVTKKHMLKILDTCNKLSTDYFIVIRWNFDEMPETPKNIKLMKWVPQNDILGHKNTKLFITHGGANGQMEALYHGVPMVTLPVIVEQPYNAKRAEYHGYSKTFQWDTFTPEELLVGVKEVLSYPKYSENIKKASSIIQSRPMTPLQVAVHSVEQIIEFGGDHLRSHAFDMPSYQYFMLDIIIPALIGMYFAISFCVFLVYKCFIQKPKPKKKQS